jgi:hypothetical protein
MNNLIRLFFILSLITCTSRGDQFQLKLKAPETKSFDVSYARVSITADHGFSGIADKLGRIAINGLPDGTYTAKVLDSRGQEKSASIKIDGQLKLKDVYVQ